MIDDVDRANTDNDQLKGTVLPGGERIPDATKELLKDLRPRVAPTPAQDDDIPF